MSAAEILLGAHIQIVEVHTVEDSIYTDNAGNTYRSGRQSRVLICVIRTFNAQQLIVDTMQIELFPRKLYRRIGLKRHSVWILRVAKHQAVVVHSGDSRLFCIIGGLFINDACKRRHLYRSHAHPFSLGFSVCIPELIALLIHPVKEFFGAYIPIDIVSIGNEHAGDCRRVITVFHTHGLIGECLVYRDAVQHKLLREVGCKFVKSANRPYGEIQRRLQSVLQMSEHH